MTLTGGPRPRGFCIDRLNRYSVKGSRPVTTSVYKQQTGHKWTGLSPLFSQIQYNTTIVLDQVDAVSFVTGKVGSAKFL